MHLIKIGDGCYVNVENLCEVSLRPRKYGKADVWAAYNDGSRRWLCSLPMAGNGDLTKVYAAFDEYVKDLNRRGGRIHLIKISGSSYLNIEGLREVIWRPSGSDDNGVRSMDVTVRMEVKLPLETYVRLEEAARLQRVTPQYLAIKILTESGDNVTKSEMAETLRFQYDVRDAVHVLNAVIDWMSDEIIKKGILQVPSFGRFEVVDMAEREAHNPRTGEKYILPRHKRVRFIPFKRLKEAVNA